MKMTDTIKVMFEGCESMDKGKVIDRLMSKHGLKESTAKSYYYTWKKEFMGGANCVPKGIKTYTIEAKDPEEPENDITIECEDDAEMKIYADKCKKQGYEVEETVTWEEVKERMETIDKPKIMLMPVVVSGGYFTYRMDYEGVKIESGLINVITTDCIAEQEAALEMWKKHYSMEVQ